MKFSISRNALFRSLQTISSVVEKRQTMPVLANVLLVVEEDHLVITGTNAEVELIARIDEIAVTQAGAVTVPGKKLFDICRSFPEDATINMELIESRVSVKVSKSQFLLATLPAEHFPAIEDAEGSIKVAVSQKELKRVIDATSFAMAQQDVRYYLNGMLLELQSEGLRAVTTDGHRLALAGMKIANGSDDKFQLIVPRKGILELGKLLEDSDEECNLVFSSKHLRAEIGHFTFTSKLIDGKFPDYQRVIPRGGDKVMIADRFEMKEVLSRTSILSHESIRGVRLFLEKGELKVFANNPDQEEAEDSMSVDYQFDNLQIGFNVSYLIEVLSVISDNLVKMTFSNANNSALLEGIESSDALYVVMPMRL